MITPNLLAAYREHRTAHFSPYGDSRPFYTTSAKSALQGARRTLADQLIRAAWDNADGYTCADYEAPNHPDDHAYDNGHIRIVCHTDDHYRDQDEWFGDTYHPECHPEIKPEILEREREAEIDRMDRDGIWGYVVEYWDGNAWEHTDSIWGFVGDDFATSGYEPDMMQSALNALAKHQDSMARDLEATRPDMYL